MNIENNKHVIAMSGATGFIGSHLTEVFNREGWKVIPLGRADFQKDPGELSQKIARADVIVNLAGAPIIHRWTEEYKKILRESRINVTHNLVAACSHLQPKPAVFISCSAVGYYDSTATHTEKKYFRARNFLGELTYEWEQEALQAEEQGIRTVIFRFGVVLGPDGGALKEMLPPFKLGLGGTIGDGKQAFSWVHIHDLSRAFVTAINTSSYRGAYNLTAPHPSTNEGLTNALAKALHRPVPLRVPTYVLRMRYGEGAQVLTKGQKVLPERLLESGFEFRFPELEEAVKDCVT